MKIIAIAGNPNSGKTTLFNELTGARQHVGNWPGVTVEKKEGLYKKNKNIKIVDLPGIYSLSPYSPEEVVAREYLLEATADVIINIIDSTNLERSLYLTTQLLETNVPMVLALNMSDILKDKIDIAKLSAQFNCPIVEISALKKTALDQLIETALKQNDIAKDLTLFAANVEQGIADISKLLDSKLTNKRWHAIKLLESDEIVLKQINLSKADTTDIDVIRQQLETAYDDDIRSIVADQRYQYITNARNNFIEKNNSTKPTITEKIDKVLTNKWLALPIFAIIMFVIYYFTVNSIGGFITDWVNEELFPNIISANLEQFLVAANISAPLQSLILDGIIGGVGAVLGFVPQIFILFIFISFLEDCGYMARIAFILDRVFRFFGLSGKSVIPLIIGSGCSVPGIMATRTIESESDRKITIMLTPFIICSAKLPIFVLLLNAFFPHNPWLMTAFYFLGIFMILVCGFFLKKIKVFKSDTLPFIMELPAYRLPQIKTVIQEAWSKAWSFIKRAGTVIFVTSGVIWFLSSFSFTLQMVETGDSILATIGKILAPIFAPLGFGNWQATVATITGFLAKETVVSTFGILAGLGEVAESDPGLINYLPTIMTQAAALSFMVFTIFAAPCFAAIGATKREMGSWKWTFITIGFQTGVAYAMAFIIYNIANLIL